MVDVSRILALALTAFWLSPSGELRHMRWQAPAPQTFDYAAMVPLLPDPAAADTRRFVALLERPLFSPTRRPPPPVPKEDAPATDALAAARLLGLFEGSKDGGVIVQIGGKPRRVRLNEDVDGWKLTAVQPRAATFTRAGQARVLELARARLDNAAVPPGAATKP